MSANNLRWTFGFKGVNTPSMRPQRCKRIHQHNVGASPAGHVSDSSDSCRHCTWLTSHLLVCGLCSCYSFHWIFWSEFCCFMVFKCKVRNWTHIWSIYLFMWVLREQKRNAVLLCFLWLCSEIQYFLHNEQMTNDPRHRHSFKKCKAGLTQYLNHHPMHSWRICKISQRLNQNDAAARHIIHNLILYCQCNNPTKFTYFCVLLSFFFFLKAPWFGMTVNIHYTFYFIQIRLYLFHHIKIDITQNVSKDLFYKCDVSLFVWRKSQLIIL